MRASLALAALLLAACQSASSAPPDPRVQPTGRTCAGIAALKCGGGDYCRMEPGQCRTVADAGGICTPRPRICPKIYMPVCGCDGRTYASSCEAAAAGASVSAIGQCK